MPLVESDGVTPTDVSYHPNDRLAEMIAEAWVNPQYRQDLLSNTEEVFRRAGLYIENPVVVTESDFQSKTYITGKQVLFVLPDPPSSTHFASPAPSGLLETARLKMAYTAAGI
jgi:hypothetical protein